MKYPDKFLKWYIILFMSLNTVSSSIAQKPVNLKSEDKVILKVFLEENAIKSSDTLMNDFILSNTSFEPILQINNKKEKVKGIYILSPPMNPTVEFICLIEGTIKPLPTKSLIDELPIIIQFLIDNKISTTNEDLLEALEKIHKLYQTRNPSKGAFLPR